MAVQTIAPPTMTPETMCTGNNTGTVEQVQQTRQLLDQYFLFTHCIRMDGKTGLTHPEAIVPIVLAHTTKTRQLCSG